MDSLVTVFLKYVELTCAKRCTVDYAREDLVHFACSRWSDLTRHNIVMAYHMRGSGEVALQDDEDMGTMMALMMDRQLHTINVAISRIGAQIVVNNPHPVSQQGLDLVEYGREDDVDWSAELPALRGQYAPRLRSEEWREMIRGVGQCFPAGAVEFRKALAMYSVQVGFKYKLLRNDRTRVTAECKLNSENGCQWRIHASMNDSDKAFYIG